MAVIKCADFKPKLFFKNVALLKNRKGNPGKKEQRRYMAITTAFDIETSDIEEIQENIMYIWQFQLGEELTIIGRTWDEFRRFIKKVKNALPPDVWLVCYIHNASYEIQYLKSIYHFTPDEVFAIASRKVLKFDMFGFIEVRCSYKLSNMRLEEFTKKMQVKHQKLSGAKFNYDKTRFPWTKLSKYELNYCINDVQGLVEAVNATMARDGDTLATIPLTSTGYVRREVKEAMRNSGKHHTWIKSILPDYELYKALERAIRGGDTHANRLFTTQGDNNVIGSDTITEVHSFDRSSSYPACMCNCQFPMSKFTKIEPCDLNSDYIGRCRTIRHKALLLVITFENIRLRNPYYPSPYLTVDKSDDLEGEVLVEEARTRGEPKKYYWEDNGRILKAKKLTVTVTDVDLEIITKIYKWDKQTIVKGWYASYDYLPTPITDLVKKYYKDKTELKGIAEKQIFYDKQKALINSIFGMFCQRPVKRQPVFQMEGDWDDDMSKSEEELLFDANKRAFVAFQWAVWVTAWARYHLFLGVQLVENTPNAHFVYCDTDSIKFVGDVDFTSYNNERIAECLKTGSYAVDSKGVTHYMGVYESEDDPETGYAYAEFRTLGAKKYAYRKHFVEREEKTLLIGDKEYKYTLVKPGASYVTVSGVNKTLGGKELDKHGGLEAFKEGFTFIEAGGTESVYSDKPCCKWYHKGKHKVEVTSNVSIKPSMYTLGISGEYERILRYEADFIDNPYFI